jgi:ribosome production factor 2
MFGSHNKKRPDNITFGRFFNHKLFDMYEFGIGGFRTAFRSMSSLFPFPGARPCLLFQGDAFEHSTVMSSVRNMFLDFFRGDDVGSVPLEQLQWVMVFTAESDKIIHFRHYHISNQRSSNPKLPHVDLEEIGPHFSLEIRRSQEAPTDLMKQATRRAKSLLTKIKRGDGTQPTKLGKNLKRDEMGTVLGRVHVGRQDMKDLALMKMKGLGKKRGRSEKEFQRGAADASDAATHERKKRKE